MTNTRESLKGCSNSKYCLSCFPRATRFTSPTGRSSPEQRGRLGALDISWLATGTQERRQSCRLSQSCVPGKAVVKVLLTQGSVSSTALRQSLVGAPRPIRSLLSCLGDRRDGNSLPSHSREASSTVRQLLRHFPFQLKASGSGRFVTKE